MRFKLTLLTFILSFQFSYVNASQKKWTWLIFINGNNNLDSYGDMDINEMEKIGSTDKINVVVQWAKQSTDTVKRLYVEKDSDVNTVTSPIIETHGELDMGNVQTLKDFIKWGVTNYPAKQYFVEVWNHGTGWHLAERNRLWSELGFFIKFANFGTLDISFDDKSKNVITTEQLGAAMADAASLIGHKVDIYGSDACLMNMVEVGAEMSTSVNLMIGSEEVEPLEGWPYDKILEDITALRSPTSHDFAKSITKRYVESYNTGDAKTAREVQLSAIDLNQHELLTDRFAALSKSILKLKQADREKLATSVGGSLKFASIDYVDAYDLFEKINDTKGIALDKSLTEDAKKAVKSYVIANETTTRYARAKGVAVWLPPAQYFYDTHHARYEGLTFDKETKWSAALKSLLYP